MVLDMVKGSGKRTYLGSYEQLALLRQPNPKAPTGLRNLCLIILMLKAGLRVSEVINLREKNIDWVNGKIRVGEREESGSRMLWIGDPEMHLLEQWRSSKPQQSRYFFSTLDGNRIKDRYVREMVKRLARKAGLGNDVHPNLLRSTFAVELYRECGNLKLLQKALGHSDFSTTRAFIKQAFEEESERLPHEIFSRRSGVPCLENNFSGEEQKLKRKERADQLGEVGVAGSMSKKGTDNEINNGQLSNDAEPVISIVHGENNDKGKVRIPALKCSRCSYVLLYRGDCPQCGTSFIDILRHWGRNV